MPWHAFLYWWPPRASVQGVRVRASSGVTASGAFTLMGRGGSTGVTRRPGPPTRRSRFQSSVPPGTTQNLEADPRDAGIRVTLSGTLDTTNTSLLPNEGKSDPKPRSRRPREGSALIYQWGSPPPAPGAWGGGAGLRQSGTEKVSQ